MGATVEDHAFGSTDVAEYQANNRLLDFLAIRNTCPKGLYITPLPEDSNQWEGVLFNRKGPYLPGIFRFNIIFPLQYPSRPPTISFLSDVFHPLVSPLTTYLFSNQDTGADTVSATDHDRLSPGSFSLRHGFPEWFRRTPQRSSGDLDEGMSDITDMGASPNDTSAPIPARDMQTRPWEPPHIVEVLFYLRAAFASAELLDAIPQDAAANPSAWHAWHTFSSKDVNRSSSLRSKSDAGMTPVSALKQQPGGARSPGEWNWDGVWEDRLRKCVQASLAEQAVFKKSGNTDELIQFCDLDQETMRDVVPWTSGSSPDLGGA
ncbi:hypothetical protein BDZ85DRAFT_2173 [Elsinoe ampelina]|uniref:UBC core domain-containing protein n=1 Tax=Elsinoe ampelina TaxID=302913 RepID=A0A6A6GNK5_9PEZI|nr:hypothetical protein BDZ85DRAFT_2173 [Elsinoe ampelina]